MVSQSGFSIMTEIGEIFDGELNRKRRWAALARQSYPDFIDVLVARELVNRLAILNRTFEKVVILTPTSKGFVDIVGRSEKFTDTLIIPFNERACEGMDLRNCKGERRYFPVAFDMELLAFKDQSVDCFIAAPGLELANDLPGVLAQIKRALKPDGLFLGGMFGGATLQELSQVWMMVEDSLRGGVTPRTGPFADVRQMGDLLVRAGFGLPVADSDRFVVRYDNALALMAEIKAMGFANVASKRSRRLVSRALMRDTVEHYANDFSDPDERIRATVEIIYLTGWGPDDSQQKPLKPGSAQQKLADALVW